MSRSLESYAQLRGRPRSANDSWIAACCLVRALPLATFNVKDYADFAEHEGPQRTSSLGAADATLAACATAWASARLPTRTASAGVARFVGLVV